MPFKASRDCAANHHWRDFQFFTAEKLHSSRPQNNHFSCALWKLFRPERQNSITFLLDFPPVKKEKNWAKESEIDRGGNNIIAKWIKSRLNELTTLRWAFRPRKGLQPGFAVEFCVVFFPNTSACTQHGGFVLLIQLCKIRLEIYPKNSTLLRRELEYEKEKKQKKSKSDFYKIPHSIVAAAAVVELFCVMLIFFLLSQP